MSLRIYNRLCLGIALLPIVLGLVGFAGLALLGCEGDEGAGIRACRHAPAAVGNVLGAMLLTGVFAFTVFWLVAAVLFVLGVVYARWRASRRGGAPSPPPDPRRPG